MFEYFLELSAVRDYKEGHPCPVDYLQIDAWARLRKVDLEQWELEAIVQMDREFLTWKHENKDRPTLVNTPLTPALMREAMGQ